MYVITRESNAKKAVRAWKRIYGLGKHGEDKVIILRKLEALGDYPTADQIDATIGNTSWTSVGCCHECGKEDSPVLIQLGEEPDYESATAKICPECLQKALDLASSVSNFSKK